VRHPRRRQLDGQRQAVQPLADGRDDWQRGGVRGESGPCRGGAQDEQAHGIGRRRGRAAVILSGLQGERRDQELLLTGHAERNPAGGQDLQPRADIQEIGDDRCGRENVLEVVEHEEIPPGKQAMEPIEGEIAPGLPSPQRLEDRRSHLLRGADRSQGDKRDPGPGCPGHPCRGRDRQARLAHAAGTGQRQ
jgi:hypothetical protein